MDVEPADEVDRAGITAFRDTRSLPPARQLIFFVRLLSEASMEPSWKHADVFPIIARIIDQASQEHHRFITAQEIAASLLQDPEGRNLVEAAREQQQEQQSLEWLDSNMVSWFSQRITVGESDWARAFERTKINGLWAYKPVAPVSR
jgi:hypothetical protein